VNPTVFFDRFKSSINILRLSSMLLADSANGGSESDKEAVHEKVAASKRSRIPVGKFIFLLAVIVVTIVILEHFM